LHHANCQSGSLGKFSRTHTCLIGKFSYKSRCKIQSYRGSSMNPMVMQLMQSPFMVAMCMMSMKW
jgi:hypothetical protein